MPAPVSGTMPTGALAVAPTLLCPFCGAHPAEIQPPFHGTGTGHFYAACPSCQRLAFFDYEAGVVKGTRACMTFKFEARLIGGTDSPLKMVAQLMREGIDAAYLEKWSAAAITFRIAAEAITSKKILGHKHAPRKKGRLNLHVPLGPLLEQVKKVKVDLCLKLGIKRGAMQRIIRALNYLRKIGNSAAHFNVKPADRIRPNDLSVDVARRKIETIFEDLYAW
jgi:hypothetical protein